VLDQLYKGEHIEAGATIKKGATIDLVLGDGLGQTSLEVPDLVGLSLREVKFVLDGSSLNLGSVFADNSVRGDTLSAVVYKQNPEFASENSKLNMGDAVDVYVTKDKSLLNK
jgi:beta-lactam-binding protein with PASTA domain